MVFVFESKALTFMQKNKNLKLNNSISLVFDISFYSFLRQLNACFTTFAL